MSKPAVLAHLLPEIHDSEGDKSNSDSLYDLGSPMKKGQRSELVPVSPLSTEQLTESPPKKMAKRKNFDFGVVELNNTLCSGSSMDNVIKAKRRRFQWSRSDRVTCSMPVGDSVDPQNDNPSRRASLPANIKIPGRYLLIKPHFLKAKKNLK